MKSGRELDALIAEKVMRFKTYQTSNPFDYAKQDKNIYTMSQLDEEGHVEETKHYSTDIAAAWEVVEKLNKEPADTFGVSRDYEGMWFAIFAIGQNVYREFNGDTAPHAICLAALKAVGV